jgi:hypothetical protein
MHTRGRRGDGREEAEDGRAREKQRERQGNSSNMIEAADRRDTDNMAEGYQGGRN